jgi:hypothetical protein
MWDTGKRTVNGKRLFIHAYDPFNDFRELKRSCGGCIGCRLEYSRQWAIRMVHESKMHSENCFITLTYNNQNLPEDRSLTKRDWQLFNKRLREHFAPKKIRFYMCGEYGSQFGRPHYHAILFGHDFPDKKHWRNADGGQKCYRSATLEKLWTFGNSEIGSVTFESCAYLARYVTKKITGELADDHYFDPATGVYRTPEFSLMSLKPGIGATFYEKFKSDIFPSDEVIMRGFAMKPPKYYMSLYELSDPEDAEFVKTDRYYAGLAHLDNCTKSRLNIREEVQLARFKSLKRKLH